jgi:phospholipase C
LAPGRPTTIGLLLFAASACSSRSSISAAEASAARQACRFTRGSLPADTLAHDARLGLEIPIDHFVIVMLENRSFDHLLGEIGRAGQPDADTAPEDAANPDASRRSVARFHLEQMCFQDTNHEWDGSHAQWNGGKNDGFVVTNAGDPSDPEGRRAMGFYDASDLPFLYALATTFAIGDRSFASVLGPTDPNRAYFYSGSSHGLNADGVIEGPVRAIFDALDDAHVSWAEYHEAPPPSIVLADTFVRHFGTGAYPPFEAFFDDAASGKLPAVSFLDPPSLPVATVDEAKLAECAARYPETGS